MRQGLINNHDTRSRFKSGFLVPNVLFVNLVYRGQLGLSWDCLGIHVCLVIHPIITPVGQVTHSSKMIHLNSWGINVERELLASSQCKLRRHVSRTPIYDVSTTED
jgi:hypothetical protein